MSDYKPHKYNFDIKYLLLLHFRIYQKGIVIYNRVMGKERFKKWKHLTFAWDEYPFEVEDQLNDSVSSCLTHQVSYHLSDIITFSIIICHGFIKIVLCQKF